MADAKSSSALGEGQKNIRFVQQDVGKAEDWKRLLEDVWAEEGRVDVLVNNAGISYTNKVCVLLFLFFFLFVRGLSEGFDNWKDLG